MLRHVRVLSGSLLCVLGVLHHGPARALTDAEAAQIIAITHPDPKSLAELQKQFPAFRNKQKKTASSAPQTVAPAATAASRNAMAAAAPGPAAAPAPDPMFKLPPGVNVLVRNDWADLGILGGCPLGPAATKTSDAKGASLSFTQDNVAANRIWAAQGMVAAVFSNCNTDLRPLPGGGESGFVERSIAIYTQVNSNYNSSVALASKNADTRTAGLAGEIAYLHGGDYEIFQFIPNVVRDEIKNTTAVAAELQYIPAWVSHPGIWSPSVAIDNVSYHFDPALDFQYASTTNRKTPLAFSGQLESFRIGPELTFLVAPFGSNLDSFLHRIKITETFHPWYEAYSGKSSYWWSNAITYNLTDGGAFALGFSYNKGLDENSGVLTNQYIVSLSAKN